jgi:hypothetical protein
MAKEYYSLKTQQIEFDTDAFTMTIISTDPHFKNVAIHTMPENMFNSQYLMFKANMFRGLATKETGLTLENFVNAKTETLAHLTDKLGNI